MRGCRGVLSGAVGAVAAVDEEEGEQEGDEENWRDYYLVTPVLD